MWLSAVLPVWHVFQGGATPKFNVRKKIEKIGQKYDLLLCFYIEKMDKIVTDLYFLTKKKKKKLKKWKKYVKEGDRSREEDVSV